MSAQLRLVVDNSSWRSPAATHVARIRDVVPRIEVWRKLRELRGMRGAALSAAVTLSNQTATGPGDDVSASGLEDTRSRCSPDADALAAVLLLKSILAGVAGAGVVALLLWLAGGFR